MANSKADGSLEVAWVKWFFPDWRADEGLRLCSLGARGFWMELLALMGTATPHGYLLVAGRSPSDLELSRQASCSVAEVRDYKAELEAAGVPSVTPAGVWFSRRLVRDMNRLVRNRQNGAHGGNPVLSDNPLLKSGITESDNPQASRITESDNQQRGSRITESDNPLVKARARASRSQKPDPDLTPPYTPPVETRTPTPAEQRRISHDQSVSASKPWRLRCRARGHEPPCEKPNDCNLLEMKGGV